MEQLLWDFETTRKMISKSAWGLRWLIRNRTIPIVKVGRKIYFEPEEVRRWVERIKHPNKEK